MGGYHLLKRLSRKPILIVSVLSIVTVSLILRYEPVESHPKENVWDSLVTANEELNINDIQKSSKTTKQINHYDVLLNSYMKSGSTLTGIILGHRKDVFYLYEPLLKLATWTYWHGNNNVCYSNRLACRPAGRSSMIAKKILNNFYECRFDDLQDMNLGILVRLGGPSWSQVKTCKMTSNLTFCIDRYVPRACKKATHRVSKVLRLTTDLLSDILRERQNLKVIHLFRDPRAVINSRNKTLWFPANTTDALIDNAKSLCGKMAYDLKEGTKILKLYPKRFRFIYYEDLTVNPLDKAKKLFKYFGMEMNEKTYPILTQKHLYVFRNSTDDTSRRSNSAFWWRQSLTWKFVQEMERVCAGTYKLLGYKSIYTVDEYRNLSISSVDIPKDYLIT